MTAALQRGGRLPKLSSLWHSCPPSVQVWTPPTGLHVRPPRVVATEQFKHIDLGQQRQEAAQVKKVKKVVKVSVDIIVLVLGSVCEGGGLESGGRLKMEASGTTCAPWTHLLMKFRVPTCVHVAEVGR